MTASIAEVTIGPETSGVAAREALCTGAWTVQGIAGLERRLEALPWPRTGEEGFATNPPPPDLAEAVVGAMYQPVYERNLQESRRSA